MNESISPAVSSSTPTGPVAAATSAPRAITRDVPHPAWIEVDLGRLKRNLLALRSLIGTSRLCFVVKANAYGHGLIPISRTAEPYVDTFGVAHLQEAVALRQAGIERPILVFGAIHEDQIEALIHHQIEFTLSSLYKAQIVAQKAAALQAPCRVHLEIDTGMHRTGVRPSSAPPLIDFVQSQPYLKLVGIYSHFAQSEIPNDPTTLRQIDDFLALKQRINQPLLYHLANSGGVLHYPASHLDMVRVGILAYGIDPFPPLLSLKAKVSYFKVVAPHQGISYGHTYRTARQTRIVTIPVGYGDGYRRDFSNKMHVLLRGRPYRIAGNVCMDQFMIDIGDDEAYVGDEVVLIGRQHDHAITLLDLAAVSHTDPREILSQFNDRIPRLYTERT